jgi:hypothetical protein
MLENESLNLNKMKDLSKQIDLFLSEYSEELENCNLDAFDRISYLQKIESYDDLLNLFGEFYFEFEDELDACHPDAFELIYKVATEHGLETY